MVKKVVIKQDAWIARLAAKKLKTANAAMVIGNTIYLHGVSKDRFLSDPAWVRHELTHVDQYRKSGILLFLLKYLYQCSRFGYYNAPLEKAARLGEQDESLQQQYTIT